ncbi:MAG: spore germination protein [Eubacteriales bacterium]|nr:spore germination protein [Eubacteriales bacterium]MCI6980406.1 spore germination protein [Clostridiales bacterium]MDY5693487.1 spore germination protein [Eubacteriales bacterium]
MSKSLLKHIFAFGRCYDEFELVETESGQPGFFDTGGPAPHEQQQKKENDSISASVDENERRLKTELHTEINPDMVLRRFLLCGKVPALAVFVNGMSDQGFVSDFILRQGMMVRDIDNGDSELIDYAADNIFAMSEVKKETSWKTIKSAIMDGCTAVFIDGAAAALNMDTRKYEHRNIQEPQNEKVVKGSQEGFVENLRTNITLIRRRVRTDDLVVELRPCGGDNNVRAAIIYREGVANETLICEVKRRLAAVDTMLVLNAGMLEQLTERHTYSLFPQVLSTERPDRTAAMLMEGHVAVIVEGSPAANVMPATLFTLMSTSEDSAMRVPQGSVIRIVRFIGACISILLPGYFLALALHHQALLSTEVLTTVVASRKMVFASIGMEMLFLLLVFQLVREAGMRVPGSIGQAIGIIGGLILGQAAVTANLASSVMLIVVALTGLGNFCIPDYSTQLSASIIRVMLVLSGWLAGLLGLFSCTFMILAWLASLKSYGVPFLSPHSPKTKSKRPMVLRGPLNNTPRPKDVMNTEEDGI